MNTPGCCAAARSTIMHRNARCAYRNRNNPDNRNRNIGFRVVVSTFFHAISPELPVRQWAALAELASAEAKNGGACSWPRRRSLRRGPGE